MGWIGVITNAGAAAIAQVAGGGHTLTVTRASIGTGTRAEANLRTATALVSEVGDISIANKKEITGGVQLRLRVLPAATTGYTAHEIGVWGKVDSGSEILIQLHQDSGTGIPVPTEAESPEFLFDFIAALAISNTGSLTITVDPDVYASMNDLEDGLAEKLDKDQGSANAGKFLKVGNDGTVTPEAVSIDTSGKLDSDQIAPAYSNAATYAVGDRCTRNGKVWKCNTAIVTPEEWTQIHWDAAEDIDTRIGAKLDKDQGSGNAGKFMKVGDDGTPAPENLPDGSTSQKGIVQLEDSTSSTSTDKAATPNSVKTAYDLASGKANPPSVVNITAAAGSWTSATPPTQTISVTGVTASNTIIVSPASNITAEQYEALAAAQILCTAQAAGEITLTCFGDEPSVNIPISVMILG